MPSLTAAVSQLTEQATSVVAGELHERFAAFAEHYIARAPSPSPRTRQLRTHRPPENLQCLWLGQGTGRNTTNDLP